jgi:hypothetical protein
VLGALDRGLLPISGGLGPITLGCCPVCGCRFPVGGQLVALFPGVVAFVGQLITGGSATSLRCRQANHTPAAARLGA